MNYDTWKATEPEIYEEYDDPEDECWNCGGEGVIYDCFEEYACVDPEGGCNLCARRCDVCRPRKRAALAEAERDNG